MLKEQNSVHCTAVQEHHCPPAALRLHQSLTVAPGLLERRSAVCEFGAGRSRGDGRIAVQALGHLVADEVDEAFEGLLHVDVVFGAGFKEFKTWKEQRRETSKHRQSTRQPLPHFGS